MLMLLACRVARESVMVATVGPNGQIIIDEEIREALGITEGWQVMQQLVDGHMIVHFAPPERDRSLYGSLANHTHVRFADEESYEAAVEAAYDAYAAELRQRAE